MDYTFEEVEVGEKFILKKFVNSPSPCSVFIKLYQNKAIRTCDGVVIPFPADVPVVRVIF